jgi:hypothetical protein
VTCAERFSPVRRRPLWLPPRRPPCDLPRRRIWTPQSAVVFDKNLGSSSANGLAFVTFNTAAAAAVGSKIFALVSWFHPSSATVSVSGGSLTWSNLKQVNNGSDRFAIFCADAASGLATNTAITATISSGAGGLLVGLASFTGLTTGTTVDTTNQNTTTGASWSSGAAAPTAIGYLLIGGAGNETGVSTTSTATNGTEIHDFWNSAAGQGLATGYIIAASTASQAITGSWVGSTSTATTGALVIFPASSPPVDNTTKPARAGMFTPQLRQDGWF